MGLPLSAYGALDYLLRTAGRGGEDRIWSAFGAVAFVLHDPVEHRELSEALAHSYDHLHVSTGHDLLFVPLVAHPHSTRQHGYAHPSPDALRELAPHLGAPAHEGGTTLDAFAAALGLPRRALPAVVLSTDLLRPEFVVLSVEGSEIVDALDAAARASRQAQRSLEALHELLPGSHWARVPGARRAVPRGRGPGLARALASVLAMLELHGIDGDDYTRREAQRRSKRVVRSILSRVRDEKRWQARQHHPMPSPPWADRGPVMTDATALLALAATPDEVRDAPRASRWESTLDPISTSFLRSARLTHVALRSSLAALGRSVRLEPGLLDFSMVVGSFGKAVEREMNTGWMEWVRWTLGAEMPAHFGWRVRGRRLRVQPVRAGWDPIDLNRPDRDNDPERWRPLPLAQAEQVMATRIAEGLGPEDLDAASWAPLAEALAPVRELRNRAVHVDPLGPDQAEEMFGLVDRLGELEAFASMARARQAVRGAAGAWRG